MQYEGDVYRPPSEARSLIIQVTIGCSHNKCTFCHMYTEKQFRIRKREEILQDLDECREMYGPWVRRVFFADGDALIVPTKLLLELLDYVRKNFPGVERITSYGTAHDVIRKSEEELKAKANATAEAKAKEAEEKAQKAAEQAQARQDSIAAVAQQKAEEDKKRNIWLMIGGVVLAVLAFVGSQVSQHFRNAKNQKNMMDMQNAVAKQAEQEAKRRARTIAQAQARQARSEMQKGARNFVNKGIGKGKNKKDVSI